MISPSPAYSGTPSSSTTRSRVRSTASSSPTPHERAGDDQHQREHRVHGEEDRADERIEQERRPRQRKAEVPTERDRRQEIEREGDEHQSELIADEPREVAM